MRHYGRENWKDYIQGRVSSLEAVLMEEHLAHCDMCLEEYVQALDTYGLMVEAPEELEGLVMTAIKPKHQRRVSKSSKRARMRLFIKYAFAATVAMMLWHFGVFGGLSQKISLVEAKSLERPRFETGSTVSLGDRMVDKINGVFDFITEKGDVFYNEK